MPNRILKESICTSETIHRLTRDEEVFFYRLLTACDDYGRMDARPRILRARCFPLELESIKDKDIAQSLERLQEVRLLELYDVEGRPYLHVTTWDKHQQIRAKRPKYPAPKDGATISGAIVHHLLADDGICPRNPIQSNPIYVGEAAQSAAQVQERIGRGMSDAVARRPKNGTGPYSPETEAFRLAELLLNLVLQRNLKAKVPQVASGPFQAWCFHVDSLLKQGHEPSEVEAVIRWCQEDRFWHKNVLSTRGLSEKYDRLYLGWRESLRSGVIPFTPRSGRDATTSQQWTPPPSEEYDEAKHGR